MTRRLLNLLTALSLLLCVAAVSLSVWSYWRVDCLNRSGRTRDIQVVSAKGRVSLRLTSYPSPRNRSIGSPRWQLFAGPPNLSLGSPSQTAWARLGFYCNTIREPHGSYEIQFVIFPWGVVAVAAAAPPVIGTCLSLRRHRPSRRVDCHSCGYDLTGNVSGVCPECGNPAASI
jgi:hypothetical protein